MAQNSCSSACLRQTRLQPRLSAAPQCVQRLLLHCTHDSSLLLHSGQPLLQSSVPQSSVACEYCGAETSAGDKSVLTSGLGSPCDRRDDLLAPVVTGMTPVATGFAPATTCGPRIATRKPLNGPRLATQVVKITAQGPQLEPSLCST